MASGYPDYEGQKSKLFTVGDWAAIGATDKELNDSDVNKASGQTTGGYLYSVPAGKTLYIIQASGAISATLAADKELNQMGRLYVYKQGVVIKAYMGFNGGGNLPLNKPLVFEAGDSVGLSVINLSNHNCDLYVSASGYEI